MIISYDGSLRIWNLESRNQIEENWGDEDRAVCTVSLSPDAVRNMKVGNEDGAVLGNEGCTLDA